MRWYALVPPATVLIAGCWWLSSEGSTLEQLRQRQGKLRIAISTAEQDRTRHAGTAQSDAAKIDWKAMLDKDLDIAGGTGDCRLRFSLRLAIRDMDGAELLARFEELDAFGRSSPSAVILERLLVGCLADKDPELLLRQYGRSELGGAFGYYREAFENYFERDPIAAVQWLNDKAGSGAFEHLGGSADQIAFESQVIHAGMATDPSAMKARLLSLPEESRATVFANSRAEPGTESAWAEVIRGSLRGEQGAVALAQVVISSSTGQLDKVNGLMAILSPTEKERDEIVSLTLRKHPCDPETGAFSEQLLDEAHTWAREISPATAGKKTGLLLGDYLTGSGIEQASQIVSRYVMEGDGDAVLTAFLTHPSTLLYPDQVMPLCDQIGDPVLREQIRQQLQVAQAEREANPPDPFDPFAPRR